ncbi:CRISPR-associated protein (Cas_APE2256) [uncultured archaeon]|nr:CRISPR-associated protein (Cas_APE2256) [uncultured archaeon]
MEKRKSLLCLVGTSSLRNSLRDKKNVFHKNVFSLIEKRNDKNMLDRFSKDPEGLDIIKYLYSDKSVNNLLVNWLEESIKSNPEIISAEANTINNYLKKCGKLCERPLIYLINTTTDDGTLCKDALKNYFEVSAEIKTLPLIDTNLPVKDSANSVENEIEDLRDNLIKIILNEMQKDNEVIYISSPGLKPHLTTATIVSNFMGCQIYYKFEMSNEVQRIDSEWFDHSIFVKNVVDYMKDMEIDASLNLIKKLPNKIKGNVTDQYFTNEFLKKRHYGIILKEPGRKYLFKKIGIPIVLSSISLFAMVSVNTLAIYGVKTLSLSGMIIFLLGLSTILFFIKHILESERN